MFHTGHVIIFSSIVLDVLAHVVLVHPIPRSNSDYIFTFEDGVCQAKSCDAFCGDSFTVETNSTTELPVESPIQIQWRTTVIHEPYEYRISLSNGGDEGFDSNILAIVSNIEAHDEPTTSPRTGSFTANITIPQSYLGVCAATSSSACTLQLYDLYYFVSCANVVVTTATRNSDENVPSSSASLRSVSMKLFMVASGISLLASTML